MYIYIYIYYTQNNSINQIYEDDPNSRKNYMDQCYLKSLGRLADETTQAIRIGQKKMTEIRQLGG